MAKFKMPDDPLKKALKLKCIEALSEISYDEIAKEAGVHRNTVAYWMDNINQERADKIVELAKRIKGN